MKLATRVPLEQLQPPENDVRETRDETAVASLAQSMGDPTVGQLQPVTCYPKGWEDLDIQSKDDMRDLVREGHDIIVLDGETRRQAAQDFLDWHDLHAWIWDSPPDNPTIAQLDANTERIDMSSYETIRAIATTKEESGQTWAEIADQIGYSPDTLSGYASVINGPDWLTDPLRDPNHPLEVGHAREIYKGTGQKFQEAMQEIGGLSEDEAAAKAAKLGRNLVSWCAEYGWTVTETREGVTRKQQDVLDELDIGGGHREQQRQAEKDSAGAQDGVAINTEPEPSQCLICGNQATTKIAIDVCDQDRGMLNDQRKAGEPLMAPEEPAADAPAADIEELASQLGMEPEELASRLAASQEDTG